MNGDTEKALMESISGFTCSEFLGDEKDSEQPDTLEFDEATFLSSSHMLIRESMCLMLKGTVDGSAINPARSMP